MRLLRVGGSMVYSTCTFNPGENEAVVRYTLDRYGGSMRLVPAGPPFVGGPGLVGRHPNMTEVGVPLQPVQHVQGNQVPTEELMQPVELLQAQVQPGPASVHGVGCGGGGGAGEGAEAVQGDGEVWLTEEEARLVQRFDPSDPQLDTIGFFVAKFVKIAPVEAA